MTERRGLPPRRPMVGAAIAAALGLVLWQRPRFVGDGGRDDPEPVPLAELEAGQLVATLPRDTDPDDAAGAINDLVARVRAHGRGGRVHLPPGTWKVDRPITLDADGIRLTGAGMRATRLQKVGRRGNAVEVDADGVTIERLTIAGPASDDAQARGHGIRIGSSSRGFLARDVVIEEVPSYGIGFQPSSRRRGRVGGLFDNLCLRNVVITGCGQDGIDIKNIDQSIEACASDDVAEVVAECNGDASFLRNLAVRRVGRRPGEHDRPGVDVRGLRLLQNVEVVDLSEGAFGIRFRRDPIGPPNGYGGHSSTLEAFTVVQTGAVQPGVQTLGAEGVEIHTGFVVDDGVVQRYR